MTGNLLFPLNGLDIIAFVEMVSGVWGHCLHFTPLLMLFSAFNLGFMRGGYRG